MLFSMLFVLALLGFAYFLHRTTSKELPILKGQEWDLMIEGHLYFMQSAGKTNYLQNCFIWKILPALLNLKRKISEEIVVPFNVEYYLTKT